MPTTQGATADTALKSKPKPKQLDVQDPSYQKPSKMNATSPDTAHGSHEGHEGEQEKQNIVLRSLDAFCGLCLRGNAMTSSGPAAVRMRKYT